MDGDGVDEIRLFSSLLPMGVHPAGQLIVSNHP